MNDYLTEALAQPELRREEKDMAAPVLLERITRPKLEKQNGQTAQEQNPGKVSAPERWRPDAERGIWEGVLLQRPADGRSETEMLTVPMTAASGAQDVPRLSERNRSEAVESVSPVWPMLDRLRRANRGAEFARRERRNISVSLPEQSGGPAAPALDAETLDRAVERDARRYDRGFALF